MTSLEDPPRSHYAAAESTTLNALRNAGIISIVRSPVPYSLWRTLSYLWRDFLFSGATPFLLFFRVTFLAGATFLAGVTFFSGATFFFGAHLKTAVG